MPRNEGLHACITLRDAAFKVNIILVAVGYSCGCSLSYRDFVELLRDRGMTVHHTTVMRWVHRYGLSLRRYGVDQTVHSKSWQIDETYIRVEGRLTYLYRAIDSNGFILDFELKKYRDYTAAKQLVKQNHFSSSAHQCFKYRNNLIEQDHRFMKRHRVRSASFHSLRTASATLSGVKIVHAIHKRTRRALSLIGFSVVDE